MTKARPKWPGELGKPIRILPTEYLTHGGRITADTVASYNKRATENIAEAVHAERLRKLPILAAYYGVGSQNYAGIAKALAAQFERKFKGDVADLRNTYGARDNKSLALTLALKHCKGFEYIQAEIKSDAGVIGRDGVTVAVGGVRPMLAKGRPEQWTDAQLVELFEAVAAVRTPGMSELMAIKLLRRHNQRWAVHEIATLENRLQDAKKVNKTQGHREFINLNDLLPKT